MISRGGVPTTLIESLNVPSPLAWLRTLPVVLFNRQDIRRGYLYNCSHSTNASIENTQKPTRGYLLTYLLHAPSAEGEFTKQELD